MHKYLLKILIFVFFAIPLKNANSQNTNISSFTINANLKNTFNAALIDSTGKYKSTEIGLGFKIPVYTHLFKNNDDKTGFYDISLQNENSIIKSEIEFLTASNTLLNINLGIRGLYFTGNKNLWLSKFSLNFFEDKYSISSPHPRFSGLFLFNRIPNRNFSYHLGLTSRYSFGIASVLPIAGLKYQISNRYKLLISLPFFAGIQYKVNSKILLSAVLHPSGAISYYTNKSMMFGLNQETLLFRKRSNSFLINASYRINSGILLKAQIGRETNRKIYFSDIKTEINKAPSNYFASALKPALMLNIGFSFKIGKKTKLSDYEEETYEYFDDGFDY